MIYIRNVLGTDFFSIVPRQTTFDKLVFTSQTTGKVTEETSFTTNIGANYVSVLFASTLKDETFYTLEVFDGAVSVYRGIAFVSKQLKGLHSVNDGVYKTRQSENEYITI